MKRPDEPCERGVQQLHRVLMVIWVEHVYSAIAPTDAELRSVVNVSEDNEAFPSRIAVGKSSASQFIHQIVNAIATNGEVVGDRNVAKHPDCSLREIRDDGCFDGLGVGHVPFG